jgi:hypothetical protein
MSPPPVKRPRCPEPLFISVPVLPVSQRCHDNSTTIGKREISTIVPDKGIVGHLPPAQGAELAKGKLHDGSSPPTSSNRSPHTPCRQPGRIRLGLLLLYGHGDHPLVGDPGRHRPGLLRLRPLSSGFYRRVHDHDHRPAIPPSGAMGLPDRPHRVQRHRRFLLSSRPWPPPRWPRATFST